MNFEQNFTSFHLDILKEVGNIGAGNAATAMSQLLNKPIEMKVPSVKIVNFEEITELVGGPETVVSSVFLRIEGDAPGSMFFMLPVKQAKRLSRDLIGEELAARSEHAFSELAISALQEAGNILAGSYLSSLADFTKLNVEPSPPALSIDMAGAILSFGLLELSRSGDHAIVINTTFIDQSEHLAHEIQGYFFLLPDPDSFKKIFQALGVPLDE